MNTSRLFIHCLLRANHSDTKWRGIDIKRGEFIASVKTLSKETGLSPMQVRTSLKKLNSTGDITNESCPQHTVFKVKNYETYQVDNKQNNKPVTNEQQTNNKPVTTDKNEENENNENNDKNKPSDSLFEYWRSVMGKGDTTKPTKGRIAKINARLKEGYTVDQIKAAIDGCAKSPFHMGVNDDGKRYDDLGLICRNGEKLEGFIAINERPIQQGLTVKDHNRQAQIEARNRELGISAQQGDFIEGESIRHD